MNLRHVAALAMLLAAFARAGAAAAPSPSPSAPAVLRPAQADALDAAVRRVMEREGIPGLAAALAEGDASWDGAYGMADLENDVPVRSTTVFRLASLSKPITATLVLQLEHLGRLKLDDPLQRHCRAYPVKRWALTLRHLLSHQGGVRSYRPGEFASTRHYGSVAEGIALFRDDPLLFAPGTRFLYSTFGYTLLGCAIEGASGTSYLDAVRRGVFEPAGMASTRDDDWYAIIPGRAHGYVRNAKGVLVNSGPADTSDKIPGGGLAGTATDVVRFGTALLDGTLLPPSALHAMLTPQRTASGQDTSAGLGLYVGLRHGQREAWHTGGQQRVSNILFLQPEKRRVLVLLTNLEGLATRMPELAREVSDALDAAETSSPAPRP